MGKLLSEKDLEYLDNLILEIRSSSEADGKVKKSLIKQLDENVYSKNWKFTTKYEALKHLKLV